MDDKDIPIWKFDKVEITQIKPFYEANREKSHDRCYITVNFGYFIVFDIGITNDEKFGLTWSLDFGWAHFRFIDSYIDNIYGDEVRKLEIMVKHELVRKTDEILNFLKSDQTFPELLLTGGQK